MKKKYNKLNRILDIPQEIGGLDPKITIIGFDEMLIENYKGILEYEDFFIKVKTHIGFVNINGFELTVNQLSEGDILIKGKIEAIDIERLE